MEYHSCIGLMRVVDRPGSGRPQRIENGCLMYCLESFYAPPRLIYCSALDSADLGLSANSGVKHVPKYMQGYTRVYPHGATHTYVLVAHISSQDRQE